jgi:GNAT superfamily N-acetyltransferase
VTVHVRPRRAADVPVLVEALLAQQPTSRYPLRDPLPFPVAEFLHEHDAVAAWTAELDGRPVGHVCHTRSVEGFPGAADVHRTCARAHGCDLDELAWVSAFFVGLEGRGLGIGRRLLSTVVDDIRASGRRPCLEVLPVHAGALGLYGATGWREVARVRPDWLRQELGDEGPDVRVLVLPQPS